MKGKLHRELAEDYTTRANAEREAGGRIEIDERFPTVSVVLSDGSEYFFQDHEADRVLDDHRDWATKLDIPIDDYILAMAQNW